MLQRWDWVFSTGVRTKLDNGQFLTNQTLHSLQKLRFLFRWEDFTDATKIDSPILFWLLNSALNSRSSEIVKILSKLVAFVREFDYFLIQQFYSVSNDSEIRFAFKLETKWKYFKIIHKHEKHRPSYPAAAAYFHSLGKLFTHKIPIIMRISPILTTRISQTYQVRQVRYFWNGAADGEFKSDVREKYEERKCQATSN